MAYDWLNPTRTGLLFFDMLNSSLDIFETAHKAELDQMALYTSVESVVTNAIALRNVADEAGIPALSANDVLANVLNTVYFLAAIVAVIVIIVAGLSYSTSGGDSGKITKAKNQILFAVIGLVAVLAAFAITNFVIGQF